MPLKLYKIKLLLSLSFFILLFSFSQIKSLLKRYKTLVFLYIFLFLQVLLVIFYPKPQPDPNLLINYQIFSHTAEDLINWEQLNYYPIEFKDETVLKEIKKYAIEADQSSNLLLHRDQLINSALLNLAINNQEEFQENLLRAKKLDPNWEGWK